MYKEVYKAMVNTRLVDAAKNGDLEECKFALEEGADIHIEGDLPLRKAVRRQKLEVCRFLLDNGANIDACSGLISTIPSEHNIEFCKMLVEKGLDLRELFTESVNPRKILCK